MVARHFTVETLARDRHPEWDDTVSALGGSLFLTAWWHALWGAEPEVRVVRDGSGSILAGAALHRVRRFGRSTIGRPPLTPYDHPLFDDARLPRPSDQLRVLEPLLTGLENEAIVDFVFRFDAPLPAIPLVHGGYDRTLSPTYVLAVTEADRWRDGLASGHARHLRDAVRAEASGALSVVRGADVPGVWPLLEATGARGDFAWGFDAAALEHVVAGLGERDAGEVWALRDGDGAPLAAALLVRDLRTATYLGGGVRPGFHGNARLFAAMIDDTLARGLAFDFEGSSLPGVERFFRGFGGEVRDNVRAMRFGSGLAMAAFTARRWWRR